MRKTLPKMWAIKSIGKKDYVTYIQPYLKKIKYHFPEWTNKNYYYCFKNDMCNAYSNKPLSYTEITLEEFKTLVLKEKNAVDVPKSFCVKAKPHQIKAIYQDLLDMGYTEDPDCSIEEIESQTTLMISTCSIDSKKQFLELFIDENYEDPNDIMFKLPQDYSKVLEFAKKQLEHPYWSKEIIVELNSDDKIFEVKVEPGKSITFDGENINIQSLKRTVINSNFTECVNSWNVNFEYVSIGCKHNIPIRDIQKVIDAYNKK